MSLSTCRSVSADGNNLQLEMELHGMLTGVSATLCRSGPSTLLGLSDVGHVHVR